MNTYDPEITWDHHQDGLKKFRLGKPPPMSKTFGCQPPPPSNIEKIGGQNRDNTPKYLVLKGQKNLRCLRRRRNYQSFLEFLFFIAFLNYNFNLIRLKTMKKKQEIAYFQIKNNFLISKHLKNEFHSYLLDNFPPK